MCDRKILEFAKLGLATAEYPGPRRGILFPTAAPAFKFTQVHKVHAVIANMRAKILVYICQWILIYRHVGKSAYKNALKCKEMTRFCRKVVKN